MPKTNKSIAKRIRLTRRGKLVRRRAGQNHFNAKESRRTQRGKRTAHAVPHSFARYIRGGLAS